MTTQIQTINFNNQSLITFEQNGTQYTAMKPICENIGLEWGSQYNRLKRDEVLNSTVVTITIVATDGKERQMVCLPIEYLNGWLFGIEIKRVKPEIRENLIRYKKECYQALFEYWNGKSKAEPQQLAPVEKTFTHTHTESDIRNIIWGHFEALRMLDFICKITPALEALGSKFAPDAYSIGVEYGSHLNYLTPTIHAMADGVDFSENNRPLRRIEQELAKPKTERIYR